MLRVEALGKIYGPGGPADVEGTGPEFGRSVSPSTGAVVGCWDVGFEVTAGEALGVIGESGSGKSTVMRCVAGDQTATKGSAHIRTVDGGESDVMGLDPSRRRSLRVDELAVVYQDPSEGLDLHVSAGGNVADRLTAAGWRNFGDIRRRAEELLARTEVPLDRMDDPVSTFSGGMRQRVQLAKALANQPSVLLLDEPVSALDPANRVAVLDILSDLTSRGATVLSVFHDIDAMRVLADRVVVMEDGVVVDHGEANQVLDRNLERELV